MADPLSRRVETVVIGLIDAELPTAQVVQFGEIERAGKTYIAVRCTQGSEDPVGSGIFSLSLEVMAHGQHSQADIASLEALFDNAYGLSAAIRAASTGSFVLPQGQAIDVESTSKSGEALDREYRYQFTIYAQTQENSDSA